MLYFFHFEPKQFIEPDQFAAFVVYSIKVFDMMTK